MRALATLMMLGGLAAQAVAVEWQDDFNGGFDQPWTFFSNDGESPPSHSDAVINDDALEILGRDADFPDLNEFVVGLVGFGTNTELAFPSAVQLTATISPTMNHDLFGEVSLDNSDVFLIARSNGASGYILALDRDSGSFDLVRSDGGNPDNIAPGMIIPDFDQNASYVLRLTAEGNRIRGEVFDTSMNLLLDAFATDDTYTEGFAGVGAAINNEEALGFERTLATVRADDVLATNENIVPMQAFFPSQRLDTRIPTASGLNAVEVRDVGVNEIEAVRTAINGVLAAMPEERSEGIIPTFEIHDPDNGATVGAIDSPQNPILTDEDMVDDNNFAQLLSGSFEVAEGLGGEYTFNFHTDDGFAMRIFYDGPAAGEDLVSVPFTKIGNNGIITSEGAVSFPHNTGDSNVQAAVGLEEGTYSFEMLWFEVGGGAFAEVSTAAGDFTGDPSLASWVLLGDSAGLPLIDGLGTGTEGPVVGIPGDFNGNGLVEQEDLDLVLANWGDPAATPPATWINDLPMGNIDQEELDRVLANWGDQAAGLGNAAGVPEPASIVLLMTALAAAWVLRR